VTETVELRSRQGATMDRYLVLGEVVAVHIDDRFIKDGRFDTAGAQPIARCDYQDYAVVERLISLARPPGAGG
jgi:flavin reductase (DIM6/NTAB) family NADH-FMN oxidoreductase RutF